MDISSYNSVLVLRLVLVLRKEEEVIMRSLSASCGKFENNFYSVEVSILLNGAEIVMDGNMCAVFLCVTCGHGEIVIT